MPDILTLGVRHGAFPTGGSGRAAGFVLSVLMLLHTWSSEVLAEDVDIEIVLAVDASGSINSSEYALQMAGYAAAFRDPSIQAAITSGPIGKVAVAMVLWSDAAFPKHPTDWHVLDSPQSADRFATEVETFHKHNGRKFGIGGGGTGIGDGVRYAIRMIEANRHSGSRKVIDVSGDGIETNPWFRDATTLPGARKLAARSGIVINGLAILTDFPKLDEWYRDHVIFGPGSFVVKANDFRVFGDAIRQKLQREFSQRIAFR